MLTLYICECVCDVTGTGSLPEVAVAMTTRSKDVGSESRWIIKKLTHTHTDRGPSNSALQNISLSESHFIISLLRLLLLHPPLPLRFVLQVCRCEVTHHLHAHAGKHKSCSRRRMQQETLHLCLFRLSSLPAELFSLSFFFICIFPLRRSSSHSDRGVVTGLAR